jgi:hypothetical protein
MLITCIKISGFRGVVRIPEDTQWSDNNFVTFSLVLNSFARDKYHPVKVADIKYEEETGWRW